MDTRNAKVIDIIGKALEASLMVKDENVKWLLIELLETCQENIGKYCLSQNNANAAEQMRLFYQTMNPVIQKLKDDSTELNGFLETSLDELKKSSIF